MDTVLAEAIARVRAGQPIKGWEYCGVARAFVSQMLEAATDESLPLDEQLVRTKLITEAYSYGVTLLPASLMWRGWTIDKPAPWHVDSPYRHYWGNYSPGSDEFYTKEKGPPIPIAILHATDLDRLFEVTRPCDVPALLTHPQWPPYWREWIQRRREFKTIGWSMEWTDEIIRMARRDPQAWDILEEWHKHYEDYFEYKVRQIVKHCGLASDIPCLNRLLDSFNPVQRDRVRLHMRENVTEEFMRNEWRGVDAYMADPDMSLEHIAFIRQYHGGVFPTFWLLYSLDFCNPDDWPLERLFALYDRIYASGPMSEAQLRRDDFTHVNMSIYEWRIVRGADTHLPPKKGEVYPDMWHNYHYIASPRHSRLDFWLRWLEKPRADVWFCAVVLVADGYWTAVGNHPVARYLRIMAGLPMQLLVDLLGVKGDDKKQAFRWLITLLADGFWSLRDHCPA